jgi:hypothetical protein
MARRKKNMTYEEELQYLDGEISKAEAELKALKNRRKEIMQAQEAEELKLLYDKIKASGKSVSEVLESLGE